MILLQFACLIEKEEDYLASWKVSTESIAEKYSLANAMFGIFVDYASPILHANLWPNVG